MADDTTATTAALPTYNGKVMPLDMRPEVTVLTDDMISGVSDMSLPPESKRGRKVTQRTRARYSVPPVTVMPSSNATITQTSGGFIITANQAGGVVHLPPLADLAGQVAPVVNASTFEVMLASASEAEPFRVPGLPVGSTLILPPGFPAEFRPVITGDPASQGWYPRDGLGIHGLPGSPGAPGKSAYDLAASLGPVGTLSDWLASLKGAKGDPGAASTVAGPQGDLGPAGKSAYELAGVGPSVTQAQWLASLKGAKGDKGDVGAASTVAGPAGLDGKSAYQLAVSLGYTGTLAQWLASLVGPQGPVGVANCRAKRVPLAAGVLGVNLSQTVTVTWPAPFADANYTPGGILCRNGTSVNLATLQVSAESWDKDGATYKITNVGLALTATGVILAAVAIHD